MSATRPQTHVLFHPLLQGPHGYKDARITFNKTGKTSHSFPGVEEHPSRATETNTGLENPSSVLFLQLHGHEEPISEDCVNKGNIFEDFIDCVNCNILYLCSVLVLSLILITSESLSAFPVGYNSIHNTNSSKSHTQIPKTTRLSRKDKKPITKCKFIFSNP